MYQNYTVAPSNPGAQEQGTPQQYWQGNPQQQQQYAQYYQQTNPNQFYQQYNQNYTNQGYTAQPNYQQNYYQNQPQQQNFVQNKQNKDGWDDNWDWGWDESKQQQSIQQMSTIPQAPPQQAPFSNANVIEESFSNNETWNWAVEEKSEPKDNTPQVPHETVQKPAILPVDNSLNNIVENERNSQQSVTNQSVQNLVSEESNIKTLNDKDVKEKLPNLALGKRFNAENLTPQWSIESQMSQDSSDGPHTHSESTYRSDNLSRNSNKSSPDLNTENSNFNYSQSGLDELSQMNADWSRHSAEEASLLENFGHGEPNTVDVSQEELASTLKELNISNMENPVPESDQHMEPMKDPVSSQSETSVSHIPQLNTSHTTPMPNALPPSNLPPPPTNLPPPSQQYPTTSSPANLPPSNFPPTSLQNPFKHAGTFSHKSLSKPISQVSQSSVTPKEVSNQLTNPVLSSPAAVNKVNNQHNRNVMGYPTANLETTPDNSERPDHPQIPSYRNVSIPQPVPENLEVAPQNDRNEYLQTAHLSSSDYGENTDFSQNASLLGMRRMVVGQQETEYNQNLNLSSDEPPPGLSRMVPGQQTEGNTYGQSNDNYIDRLIDGQPTDDVARNPFRQADGQQTSGNYAQNAAPRRPIGLDRMVPGEPSNDDYSRSQQYQSPNYSSNDQRVVTGVDHDYVPLAADVGNSDIREQNMDGSDYSEHTSRTPRNILGARESNIDLTVDYGANAPAVQPEIEQQREVTMEGENLQDLSVISSTEFSFSRDQTLDGADVKAIENAANKTDVSDSLELPPTGSRRQSLNRLNTSGEESERDRAFKASPRRDREKRKSSKEHDREKDKYSREDRKYEKDSERRSIRERDDKRMKEGRRERDRRDRDRDRSPDDRRHRRSARSHKYETEDTDYYSDRERERR